MPLSGRHLSPAPTTAAESQRLKADEEVETGESEVEHIDGYLTGSISDEGEWIPA